MEIHLIYDPIFSEYKVFFLFVFVFVFLSAGVSADNLVKVEKILELIWNLVNTSLIAQNAFDNIR